MKVLKDINKIILIKVIEIMFTILFIIVSANLYKSEKAQEVMQSLALYKDFTPINLSIRNQINYSMYPMDDEKAMQKLIPCTLTVNNETYKEEFYTLVLKMDIRFINDISYLHISINNSIYSLDTLEKEVLEDKIIFVLDRNTIVSGKKDYNIRIWYNELNENYVPQKLLFNFELITQNTNL